MTQHYYFQYQTQLNSNPALLLTSNTLNKLEQQMVLNNQTVQILTDEIKTLTQKVATKPVNTSYLLLLLQQLERTFTYAVLQKVLHKVIYVWKNFI